MGIDVLSYKTAGSTETPCLVVSKSRQNFKKFTKAPAASLRGWGLCRMLATIIMKSEYEPKPPRKTSESPRMRKVVLMT